jgi:hypothetical protein
MEMVSPRRMSATRMLELAAQARREGTVALSSQELMDILHDLGEGHRDRERLRVVAQQLAEVMSTAVGVRFEVMGHEVVPLRRRRR